MVQKMVEVFAYWETTDNTEFSGGMKENGVFIVLFCNVHVMHFRMLSDTLRRRN